MGTDKSGKRINGEISAKSNTAAATELRRMGIRVVRIKKKPKPLFTSKAKITTKDIAVFSRQLATMLEAGVPLVQSFDIIGKGHENMSMQELLLGIKADIEGGDTLAEALGKRPCILTNCFATWSPPGNRPGCWKPCWTK